jgi:beta-glucanase (GH16 family)
MMAATSTPASPKPTFDDEFNTLSLDNGATGTWAPSIWYSPNGSTDSTLTSWEVNPLWGPTSAADANVYSVSNGVLSMAIKPTPADVSAAVNNTPFLAGELTTYRSFSQTYGYFEMNAKLASGAGVESAFWLLPADGSWPPELDAAEVLGNSPTTLVMTAHSSSGTNPQWATIPDPTQAFHTYGVDWEPDKVTWYFDGKQMAQQATPADMNKPMYMLLNTLTGTSGSWVGAPNTGQTSQMQVNYVRAYASKPDLSSGGSPDPAGSSVPPSPTSSAPLPATDTLVLSLSEDAWQGDAQCVITLDGKTLGGTVTVTASHAQGKSQTVSLSGQWGPGAHDVGVQFINDAWGGTAATDRNLYVGGVKLDGQASASAPAAQMANGTAHLATGASPLVLQLSEDAYQGDAQFTVSVDGKALGGAQAVGASHAAGGVQNFAFAQAMAAGTHDVAVSFLNDAWGGTAATDRNLYVHAIDANGAALPGTAATLMTTSTQHFSVVVAAHG